MDMGVPAQGTRSAAAGTPLRGRPDKRLLRAPTIFGSGYLGGLTGEFDGGTDERPSMPVAFAEVYDWLALNGVVGWLPDKPKLVVEGGMMTLTVFPRTPEGAAEPWEPEFLDDGNGEGVRPTTLTTPLLHPLTDRVRSMAALSGLTIEEKDRPDMSQNVRAAVEVVAGLIPGGAPDERFTKRFVITEAEWRAAVADGAESILLAERNGQALAYAGLLMLQPSVLNWVHSNWVWY